MSIIYFSSKFSGFDSCTGDSGGPIAYRQAPEKPWFQVGIVSFGKSKPKTQGSSWNTCGTWYGVYTKLEKLMPWIESKLEE